MNTVEFNYLFTTNFAHYTPKERRDSSIALEADATFEIKINNDEYFKEDIAILEFYIYLEKWLKKLKRTDIDFKYFTLEVDDDEPLISLLKFNDKSARLKVLWPSQDLYNVFEYDYILSKFRELHEQLGRDLEEHYQIRLKDFVGKIPMQYE